MKIRAVIVSGAALALTMSGALAQDDGRYGSGPQYSTPGEMQQTDQLNQQARSGTTQSPAALNGEDQAQYSNPAQGSGNDGGYQAAPSPQQAQYDQQQQQYQQQMQQYGDQQQNYRSEHQRYAQDIRDYDVAQYAWSYPQAYEYRYGEDSGLKPLYLIAEPSQQLWQAPVEGPGGRWVGRVRNVEIAPDGRPNRVEIALNRRVSVWVRPGDLRFDPSDHILYTDLTRDALWEMPGATIESSPL